MQTIPFLYIRSLLSLLLFVHSPSCEMGCIQCCQPSIVSFPCEHTLTGHLPEVMTKSLSHGTSVCACAPEGHNLARYQPDKANTEALRPIKIVTIHGLWNPHIFFPKSPGNYRRYVCLDGAQGSKRMFMRVLSANLFLNSRLSSASSAKMVWRMQSYSKSSITPLDDSKTQDVTSGTPWDRSCWILAS